MPALNYVKNVLPRAVHIRVQPQPQNLHETRTILRILKDFGEVDSFRSLRNDPVAPAPNTILAVFRHKESAERLIAEGTLQFQVEPRINKPSGVLSLVEDDAESPPGTPASHGKERSPPREFHLTARSSSFDHQAYIRRQEFYWGFRSVDSFVNSALRKSVPIEGLSTITSRQAQIPTRIVNKMMDEVTNRKTLRELAQTSTKDAESTEKDRRLSREAASSSSGSLS